jgi:hypothetical protein
MPHVLFTYLSLPVLTYLAATAAAGQHSKLEPQVVSANQSTQQHI